MRTLERKLRPVTRVIAKVESVSEQADRVTDPAATGNSKPPPATVAERKSAVANTQEWLVAITTTLMVTYFLLAGGTALLMRLEAAYSVRGVGADLPRIVTRISESVGRYFATVTLSSLVLGVGTTATMHWLGMPNPLLWGVVAFLLNYIPYAGPATTLVLLTVVAVVSFDGLGKALAVAGAFLVLSGIEGQILQPVLVGRRLDVSPLVVLLSLWFGGWLWGIAGVALAVPILISVKSLFNELQGQAAGEAGVAPLPDSTMRSRAAQLLANARRQRRASTRGEPVAAGVDATAAAPD
jgi:predicted PurR-regulated permease PerM